MFNVAGNLNGPPDITNALQMLFEGLDMRRKRQAEESQNLLAQNIGGQISSGDMSGAANTAFQAGDLETGIDITNMGKQEQAKVLTTVGRLAAMADSPEKYQRVVPILTKMLGPDFAREYGDFTQREALIAETVSLEDQFKLQDRATKAEEQSAKAPDLVEIFDESGQPQKMTWDKEQRKFVPVGGPKAKSKSGGVNVIHHPDGTVETIVGGEGGPGLTGPTANKVQEKAINTAELGSRMAGIMQGFKPEYQTLGNRFANAWRGLKSKVDPKSLGPGEEKELTDFAAYRSSAIGNLNRVLNELSGAAVSATEGERIKAQYPNPGTGIFDGDDPITFKAKLEAVMNEVNRALARYEFYQKFGTPSSPEEIPLNNVKQIGGKWYVKRGNEVFEVGAIDAAQP